MVPTKEERSLGNKIPNWCLGADEYYRIPESLPGDMGRGWYRFYEAVIKSLRLYSTNFQSIRINWNLVESQWIRYLGEILHSYNRNVWLS